MLIRFFLFASASLIFSFCLAYSPLKATNEQETSKEQKRKRNAYSEGEQAQPIATLKSKSTNDEPSTSNGLSIKEKKKRLSPKEDHAAFAIPKSPAIPASREQFLAWVEEYINCATHTCNLPEFLSDYEKRNMRTPDSPQVLKEIWDTYFVKIPEKERLVLQIPNSRDILYPNSLDFTNQEEIKKKLTQFQPYGIALWLYRVTNPKAPIKWLVETKDLGFVYNFLRHPFFMEFYPNEPTGEIHKQFNEIKPSFEERMHRQEVIKAFRRNDIQRIKDFRPVSTGAKDSISQLEEEIDSLPKDKRNALDMVQHCLSVIRLQEDLLQKTEERISAQIKSRESCAQDVASLALEILHTRQYLIHLYMKVLYIIPSFRPFQFDGNQLISPEETLRICSQLQFLIINKKKALSQKATAKNYKEFGRVYESIDRTLMGEVLDEEKLTQFGLRHPFYLQRTSKMCAKMIECLGDNATVKQLTWAADTQLNAGEHLILSNLLEKALPYFLKAGTNYAKIIKLLGSQATLYDYQAAGSCFLQAGEILRNIISSNKDDEKVLNKINEASQYYNQALSYLTPMLSAVDKVDWKPDPTELEEIAVSSRNAAKFMESYNPEVAQNYSDIPDRIADIVNAPSREPAIISEN